MINLTISKYSYMNLKNRYRHIGMSLLDNISRNANNRDSTPGLFTCRYGSDLAIITAST